MLYGEKLNQNLKNEQNPINKMYLNELLLNWEKVENSILEPNESLITSLTSAISSYTKYLTTPKFKFNSNKKCGFMEDHDIFKAYYLYDIVDILLKEAGITEDKGVKIKVRPFCIGFSLLPGSYENIIHKPYLEIQYNPSRNLTVGLELDINYRLVDKKAFNKVKIFIPLIIFFIEKVYNEKHFDEIEKIKEDMIKINPNAMLICITESVDKKLIRNYNSIKDHLYVLRCNYKNDPHNDLQPQVLLSLFTKIKNFAKKDLVSYDNIVPFGNIDLANGRT